MRPGNSPSVHVTRPAAGPLERIRVFRHNRLIAVIALLALLFASSAYVAHGLQHDKPLSTHTAAHCDLCLHFSGTAGAPDHLVAGGHPPLAAVAPATLEILRFESYEHPTHRLPRAPPALT